MAHSLAERFALKLSKYTACRLVQCFSIITVDEAPGGDALGADWQANIRYQLGLTMTPEEGVVVKLAMQ